MDDPLRAEHVKSNRVHCLLATLPILFPSEKIAHRRVAGIPAAIRVSLLLEQQGLAGEHTALIFAVPGGWQPGAALQSEIDRLLDDRVISFAAAEELGDERAIDGVAALNPPEHARERATAEIVSNRSFTDEAAARRDLAVSARRIIAATGKPTDGLISRSVNRPFSQFLSYHLLKLDGVRPIHATAAAAAVGVAMALFLLFGGPSGLYIGAVLFQLASMIDGVDGEIARATFRSSKLGATLDTASDAATNFAFIAGVAFNLWQQGEEVGAIAGFAGLALLVTGLTILGVQSIRRGGPLSFDALKHDAQAAASPLMMFLAKITSRDVYALAFAVLILVGLASEAMIGFALAASLWLLVVLAALVRRCLADQP